METSVNVYADRRNQVSLYAVQGEQNARTFIFSIIEKSGEIIPTSNATVVNKMIDLTGYTITFYVIKPDGETVSTSGTITDAENGVISVTLSTQMLNTGGDAECVIALTKSGQELRIVGITLTIDSTNLTN